MGETWTATGYATKSWTFRSAQILLLGMVLVQVYIVMQPAAREKPAEAAGTSLPRPHPTLRLQQNHHHYNYNYEDKEEEGQEGERKRHARRGLRQNPNLAVPLAARNSSTQECPAAYHRSNSITDDPSQPRALAGTAEVWAALQLAEPRKKCRTEPCCHGKHVHTYRGGDLGEEMSHVQGAAVVRRPDLAQDTKLEPAHSLDFVETLQSYFPISRDSLLRRMLEANAANETSSVPTLPNNPSLMAVTSFLDAVRDGDSAAGELVTPYCEREGVETPKRAIGECLRVPTVVSMADVLINKAGFIWNENDFVAPIACKSRYQADWQEAAVAAARRGHRGRLSPEARRFEKVFIMTQEWGPNWYHFTVEHLPRIMVFLDVLLEDEDIRIAVHFHDHDRWHDFHKEYDAHVELLGLLGIKRERIILVMKEIHADLAILPTSTVCGDPDANLVNLLRHALLQGLYPSTDGVPPSPPRPTVVLVVRNSLRGLVNNDEVKEALQNNFPNHDVVEFFGNASVRSQLETFATASLVVAPHGAGLSNTMVAPLHTAVLEIAPISCPPCFVRLTLKLHHVYARHTGGGWNLSCESWYEPDVDDIINISRDLLEAKREADAADPPTVAFGQRYLN